MKVVKFLGSGLMEPMEVALLLVVAAADTRDDDYVVTCPCLPFRDSGITLRCGNQGVRLVPIFKFGANTTLMWHLPITHLISTQFVRPPWFEYKSYVQTLGIPFMVSTKIFTILYPPIGHPPSTESNLFSLLHQPYPPIWSGHPNWMPPHPRRPSSSIVRSLGRVEGISTWSRCDTLITVCVLKMQFETRSVAVPEGESSVLQDSKFNCWGVKEPMMVRICGSRLR